MEAPAPRVFVRISTPYGTRSGAPCIELQAGCSSADLSPEGAREVAKSLMRMADVLERQTVAQSATPETT